MRMATAELGHPLEPTALASAVSARLRLRGKQSASRPRSIQAVEESFRSLSKGTASNDPQHLKVKAA